MKTKKHKVELTPEDRQMLETLVRRGEHNALEIRRAHILLKADAKGPAWTDAQIAEAFGCHTNTVSNVRKRWTQLNGLPALKRKPQKKKTIAGYMPRVKSVAFSPDGKTFASQNLRGEIHLWDTNTGEKKRLFRGSLTISSADIGCLSFSPDGQTLASGIGSGIDLWNATIGELKKTLTGHDSAVNSISFSPEGSLLASGSQDGTVRLWDAMTGEQQQKLTHQTVSSVSFSLDGQILASGSLDGNIYLWDVTKGELKQKLENQNLMRVSMNMYPPRIHSVSFSPDRQILASGGPGNTIRLWDVVTGSQKQTTLIGHAASVYCVSFSPDSATLVSGHTDGTIRLWDANTGQHKRMLSGHTDVVTSVSFSPDSQVLVSGSWDCSVLLWDCASSPNATDNVK